MTPQPGQICEVHAGWDHGPVVNELRDWTTLRVGGPAAAWHTAETDDDIRQVVSEDSRALILGGGSNLVVSDSGYDGSVVRMATRGISITDAGDHLLVDVMAGECWDDLVAMCVAEGWSGIEAMSGIPGLVGATPVQNVGAYGQDVAGVIASVRVLDRVTGEDLRWTATECDFGFRTSRIKRERDRWVVLSVSMTLSKTRQSDIAYAELASILGTTVGSMVNIQEIREAVLLLRRRKGMVLDESDHDTWSVGSFFVNPILPSDIANTIDSACPRYPAENGVKLPAAWLIESAGIHKGFALPDSRAAVSTKHTLALTNQGGATTSQILELATHIRGRVREQHGIDLAIEPVVII